MVVYNSNVARNLPFPSPQLTLLYVLPPPAPPCHKPPNLYLSNLAKRNDFGQTVFGSRSTDVPVRTILTPVIPSCALYIYFSVIYRYLCIHMDVMPKATSLPSRARWYNVTYKHVYILYFIYTYSELRDNRPRLSGRPVRAITAVIIISTKHCFSDNPWA